jgi:DNA polymerase III alpha subunit (gram-positive type)
MSYENYVIYVADTETTGTDHLKNEVIELSIIRLFLGTDKPDEQKSWLLRATSPENISDEALAVNGHKREDILGISKFGRENYLLPKVALPQIENWIAEDDMTIDDRILAGHNISFDFNFLQSAWDRNDASDTFPFQTGSGQRIIDTKQLALIIDVLGSRRRKYYNLGSIVKAYGIPKEKAHRADADARMTKNVLMKQIDPFMKVVKEAFASTYDNE